MALRHAKVNLEDVDDLSFHVDHIISSKQLGPTTAANLAPACLRCNVAKGTDPGTFIGRPHRLVRLYHPRLDSWTEHFRLSGARIISPTKIAEVTILVLNLNAADRLLLRRSLIKAGRYPSRQTILYLRD